MTTPTNDELKAMLLATLQAVLLADKGALASQLTEVRVTLGNNGQDLTIDAWAKSSRIKADSLAELPEAVAKFDAKSERKAHLEAQLAQIKAELEQQ